MTEPFHRRDDEIRIALSTRERAVLRMVPDLLDDIGSPDSDPAAARLHPSAYPEDPGADTDFRDMVDIDLARARARDRRRFATTLESGSMSRDEAEMWLRVVGDARLALAARMGIESEEWETDRSLVESSAGAMLHYLGYIQDALLQVLTTDL